MDLGRCINDSLDVYKKNLGPLVLGAFLFELLCLVSLSILAGPLSGGWSLMTLNALRRPDKRVEFGDMFACFNQFGRLVGLFYVTLIPILIGSILCIVPGLLLMTLWLFAFLLVVDRHEGVFSSLSNSQSLVTRAGFGQYLILVILLLAISLVPTLIPYVGFVIAWFVTPIAWLIEAAAYQQLVDEQIPAEVLGYESE